MKTTFFKYALVGILVMGGVAGLVWARQTYAGFPLHFPTSTQADQVECGNDDESENRLPPPVNPAVPFEKIVEGIVVDVKGNTIVINTSDRGLVTLLLSPETRVWKGKWDSTAPIEIGDDIIGYGDPDKDGAVFEMEQLEINVVNLRGGITKVTPTAEGLVIEMLESRSEQIEIVHIDAETMITTEDGSYPFGERAVEFKVDDGVQIVGVRLKDGTVLASTIF
ncbi:MAG: hypothetical protein WHX52_02405 [Anaerolineae bacterium]